MIELLEIALEQNLTNKKELIVSVQPLVEDEALGFLFRSGKLDCLKLSNQKSLADTEQFLFDSSKVKWEFWMVEGNTNFLYSELIDFDEVGAKFSPYPGFLPTLITGKRRFKLSVKERKLVYELEYMGKTIDLVLTLTNGVLPEEENLRPISQ